ncbi:hypothetical protein JXL19_03155 [bacterium]|nr:hypothetical protein [bacterium]
MAMFKWMKGLNPILYVLILLFILFVSFPVFLNTADAYYGSAGFYGGGIYGGLGAYGLLGGLYGLGALYGGIGSLYGLGGYYGLYGLGSLYGLGGTYGLGSLLGLSGLYGLGGLGGIYGMLGLYGMGGIYGGLGGLSGIGGLYGGLGGLGGLISSISMLSGLGLLGSNAQNPIQLIPGVSAEQAGTWTGTWTSYVKLNAGLMTLTLVEDAVNGILSGEVTLFLNKFTNSIPGQISGLYDGGTSFILTGGNQSVFTSTLLLTTATYLYSIELNCTLTSQTTMNGTYLIRDPLKLSVDYGSFNLTLSTPII